MKKKMLYFLFPVFFFAISGHDVMSRPSRLREKVEQAKISGTLVKKVSLQDLLQNVVPARPPIDEVGLLINRLEALTWANNAPFIQMLLDKQQESKSHVVQLLKDEVLKRYAQEKYPFITFICELKHEHDMIQKSTTELFSMINKKHASDGGAGHSVQQGLDTIVILKGNLEILLNLVNDLYL